METLRTTITANNLPLIPYVTENTIIKVCFLKNCLNSAYFFKLAIKKTLIAFTQQFGQFTRKLKLNEKSQYKKRLFTV